MKLDDEMRAAAYAVAEPVKLDDDYDDPILRTFAAGYRMGLERAAQTGYDWLNEHVGIRTAEAVAAAIREMAHD